MGFGALCVLISFDVLFILILGKMPRLFSRLKVW